MAIDNDHVREKLYDVAKSCKPALLVTRGEGGGMHARPMHVAEVRADGDAYFATGLDSAKVREIEAGPAALVAFPDGASFATLTGIARAVRDRSLTDRLYSAAWKVWFPGGRDDPNLAIIKLDASAGEYWDNSGWQGIKYAARSAKAVATGEKPVTDEAQHAKVRL